MNDLSDKLKNHVDKLKAHSKYGGVSDKSKLNDKFFK